MVTNASLRVCPWCKGETTRFLENGSHVICYVCCWEENPQLAAYLGIPFPYEKLPGGCDGDFLRAHIKAEQSHGHELTITFDTPPTEDELRWVTRAREYLRTNTDHVTPLL